MVPLTTSARPLDSFPLIHTNNAEEMKASVERAYIKPVMEFVGRKRTLRAIMNHCQLKSIGLAYAEFGADILWNFPPSHFVAQVFPIDGSAEMIISKKSVFVDANHGAVISAGTGLGMKHDADYKRLMLTIDAEALSSTLATFTGASVRVPLRFDPKPNSRSQTARLLRDNFAFLVQQLSVGTPIPSFVMAEFELSLIMLFLHANHHNYSDLLTEGATDIASREVRQAEEYIEANWNKPLDLLSLATVTGVSIRNLSRKFRQTRGYSPTEFLKRVRLCHARRRLMDSKVTNTVSEVALACGFVNIARFRKDYFEAFGEHPTVAADIRK